MEQIKEKSECKEDMGYLELMDIIDRLNREKTKLLAENYQLKLDNEMLHNKLNEEENDDPSLLGNYETSYYCGCESEEELKTYEEALSNMSVKK